MNLFLAWNIFSYRRELAYVATSFFLVILLPIIAVIVLTQTGINVVSDTLAEINEVTQVVELKNPLDGSIYKSIEGPFVWPTTGVITGLLSRVNINCSIPVLISQESAAIIPPSWTEK